MPSKSSSNWFVPVVVCGLIAFVLLKSCRALFSDEDDSRRNQNAATAERIVTKVAAAISDSEPQITKQYVSGSEKDVLVIRSRDWEYVRINELVFCWRGTNLVGVFNKDSAIPISQAMTNTLPK